MQICNHRATGSAPAAHSTVGPAGWECCQTGLGKILLPAKSQISLDISNFSLSGGTRFEWKRQIWQIYWTTLSISNINSS